MWRSVKPAARTACVSRASSRARCSTIFWVNTLSACNLGSAIGAPLRMASMTSPGTPSISARREWPAML